MATFIEDSKLANATYTVRVDRTTPDTPFIVIDGLTNTASGEPLAVSVPIKQEAGVLTTDLESISITANSPISPYSETQEIKATFGASAEALTFTVEIRIGGAPIQEWLNADTLSSYISASFASQAVTLSLSGNTISVNGLTNAENGVEGSFDFSSLPSGFTVDPKTITLPDPDGTDTAKITLDPDTFTISETDNKDKNSQEYTIGEITFKAITAFTPSQHITITDDSITDHMTNNITDITIKVNTENLITITGLSNAVGEKKAYTLTIEPVQDLFSTGDSPITIAITEPDGFSPGNGVLTQGNGDPSLSVSFTITNDINPSNSIDYTVVVPFSGAKVNEWLTADTFPNYFTGATYAGQTALLSFDGSTIAIGGDINNVLDGEILLTRTLPLGYSVTGLDTLSDPDGDGIADLTDGRAGTITIAEEDTANTNNYDVTISLAAYRSPVEASQISVTGIDGFILDLNIDIQIEQNIITISGLSNGTSGSGSVSITQPTTGEFTVVPNPFPLSFDDSDGIFATEGTQIGTVDIVSALGTVSHTVILSLTAYTSPVETSHVTAMFNNIEPSKIEISGTNIIISGFTNIAGSAGLGSVFITEPTTMEFTVSPIKPASFPFSFNDPDGTDSEELRVGTVNVTSADLTALHTIIVRFSAPISLKINSENVPSGTVTILKDGTVNLIGLGACELFSPQTLEVVGNPSVTVRGFPRYFNRRIDSTTGLAPYTVTRDLILEDATGVLDATFTVSITGFPACDDASIFTNTKTGADAENAYEIDSAPKLELLSHLVRSDHASHVSKFYKLTTDIDLGLAGLPWNQTTGGETGEGFPPIGLSGTKFQGTFDCAGNSISNLYINKANSNDIGLFGYTSGANIKNCRLVNVHVTGNTNVGGLAGFLNSGSSITNSYAIGFVSGTERVGGLAGRLNSSSSITSSYATSSVTGTGDNVGGLVGDLNSSASITNSYSTGSVTGNDDVGGLAGYVNSSSIENSYATGSVEGTNNVGGLAGRLNSSSSRTSSITNSYAIGFVSGTSDNVGGLVGDLDSSSTITNSYWNTLTSEQSTSAGVGDGAAVGKNTADLKSGSVSMDIFTDWNNPDIVLWKFDPTSQYPRLIYVVCANRQYPDPNNVPTACTNL